MEDAPYVGRGEMPLSIAMSLTQLVIRSLKNFLNLIKR